MGWDYSMHAAQACEVEVRNTSVNNLLGDLTVLEIC
jgi:hypothetical protein